MMRLTERILGEPMLSRGIFHWVLRLGFHCEMCDPTGTKAPMFSAGETSLSMAMFPAWVRARIGWDCGIVDLCFAVFGSVRALERGGGYDAVTVTLKLLKRSACTLERKLLSVMYMDIWSAGWKRARICIMER